mmetsp:Transcript_12565/g.46436  ORF Transcript_12565/g.46436 Transcript_12565/m.46436 type:complete len:307 (+) Transcript_12565:213-1133(+)
MSRPGSCGRCCTSWRLGEATATPSARWTPCKSSAWPRSSAPSMCPAGSAAAPPAPTTSPGRTSPPTRWTRECCTSAHEKARKESAARRQGAETVGTILQGAQQGGPALPGAAAPRPQAARGAVSHDAGAAGEPAARGLPDAHRGGRGHRPRRPHRAHEPDEDVHRTRRGRRALRGPKGRHEEVRPHGRQGPRGRPGALRPPHCCAAAGGHHGHRDDPRRAHRRRGRHASRQQLRPQGPPIHRGSDHSRDAAAPGGARRGRGRGRGHRGGAAAMGGRGSAHEVHRADRAGGPHAEARHAAALAALLQ